MMVEYLLTYGKYLHDRIISQIGEVWAHETNLAPPPFFKCQESEHAVKSFYGYQFCLFMLLDFEIVDLYY